MKHILLLFLSTMLLLFTLAHPSKPAKGLACALKSELKAADGQTNLKRPCARKCLKHQTHSEPKGAANVLIDCGQQLYAVVGALEADTPLDVVAGQQFSLAVQRRHLSPVMGADPDPPRFS